MGSQSGGTRPPMSEPGEEQVAVVRPGATRPGERRYFRLPGGRIVVRELHAAGDGFDILLPAPEGAAEISAEEGERLLEAGRKARQDDLARQEAEQQQARRDDYEHLVEMGIRPSVAARLSGYQPDETRGRGDGDG
jgi:hypothetical protein